MNEAFDPLNLLLLAVAVIIFLRLRSVLGRRTGNERPPVDPFTRKEDDHAAAPVKGQDGNVVPLPSRGPARPVEGAAAQDDDDRPPIWKGFATAGSPVAAGIEAIVRADPSFAPKTFLEGARSAYEMIVMAFAEGDRLALRNLLSKEVYEGFASALDQRERDGLTNATTFVGISSASIVDARMEARQSLVTINFVCELITTVKDRAGEIVEGDPMKIHQVNDIWTFARDTSSRDPNWKLIGTEAPSGSA